MVDADVVDGGSLEPLIKRFLANAEVSYLHAHYAKRGCYARADRTHVVAKKVRLGSRPAPGTGGPSSPAYRPPASAGSQSNPMRWS